MGNLHRTCVLRKFTGGGKRKGLSLDVGFGEGWWEPSLPVIGALARLGTGASRLLVALPPPEGGVWVVG